MKLSIGIVGLPNVGKSTLFKLITKAEVNIANYPFATIDPNIGVVPVPDERLQVLAKISKSRKIVPAVVEFYDIAGLVKGANKGEGLGNQFLTNIREVNAVLQVVRCFKGNDIIHVEGGVNPLRDVEIIKTELALKDIETVEKRLAKAESDARSGKKEYVDLKDSLGEIKAMLEKGKFLGLVPKDNEQYWKLFREMNLLTAKPQLYLLNGTMKDVPAELVTAIREIGADYLAVDLATVSEVPELIKKAYDVLNLISFFTTGEDETRAWTIERGTRAPQAAGVIHTDFEKKFIRAEVVKYERLVEAGGWNGAKQKGWLKVEGKDYVVEDGDVMVVRHG
ncbi:MAG TPA: redox-regulated ATPase YchF [Candidatus Paceibacterota bacterium]|nr:redox-regulated ATPase YchF [Candidatus Paceibacterota bacterium]